MAVTPEYVRKDLVEYLLGYYGAMLTWSKEDVLSEIKRGVQENSISKDLVEVVRCKECKHCRLNRYTESFVCNRLPNANIVTLDHYCSYGERKCDNG